MPQKPWICCQIGAREHYAVPRALSACGCDVQLATDVWALPNSAWWMPKRWRQRWHAAISPESVTSWNLSALVLKTQLAARGLSNWNQITVTDAWFQAKCAAILPALVERCTETPTVFAYSYGAKAIFEQAKRLGCPTVLGQIDPGPVEMRLVQQLEKKYGHTDLTWPHSSYWKNWKAECSLADRIIVNSDWSRRALLQEGIQDNAIQVIPLTYVTSDPKIARQVPSPPQFTSDRPLRVLFLGQVNLRKGVKELAEAIKILSHAPVEWTIVGSGDRQLMAELSVLKNAVVVGSVSRQEAKQFYKKADVFVLPTHSDGFAITQLEAAAYGLPIIASEYCGRVVIDGENGICLDEVSGQAIAKAIRRLINNPAEVRLMARRQSELQRLTLGEFGARLLKLEQPLVGLTL